SNNSVGASANDLLSGINYSDVVIEIQYMPGYTPDAAALSHFQSMLSNTINKSSGVQIVQKQISSGGKGIYSLDDIKLVEKQNRTFYTKAGIVGVYILIADAGYTDNA